MERIDLAQAQGPTTTHWHVKGVDMDRANIWDANGAIVYMPSGSYIHARFIGQNGLTHSHTWRGASADVDILAIQKANLTTVSMHRRIMLKAIADNVFAGTISGTPD